MLPSLVDQVDLESTVSCLLHLLPTLPSPTLEALCAQLPVLLSARPSASVTELHAAVVSLLMARVTESSASAAAPPRKRLAAPKRGASKPKRARITDSPLIASKPKKPARKEAKAKASKRARGSDPVEEPFGADLLNGLLKELPKQEVDSRERRQVTLDFHTPVRAARDDEPLIPADPPLLDDSCWVADTHEPNTPPSNPLTPDAVAPSCDPRNTSDTPVHVEDPSPDPTSQPQPPVQPPVQPESAGGPPEKPPDLKSQAARKRTVVELSDSDSPRHCYPRCPHRLHGSSSPCAACEAFLVPYRTVCKAKRACILSYRYMEQKPLEEFLRVEIRCTFGHRFTLNMTALQNRGWCQMCPSLSRMRTNVQEENQKQREQQKRQQRMLNQAKLAYFSFRPKPDAPRGESDASIRVKARQEAADSADLSEDQAFAVLRILSKNDDPWEIFGVDRPKSAGQMLGSLQQAKICYRTCIKQVHPDKNPHPKAAAAFHCVDKAWKKIQMIN
ncbi:MAG: hypothetical protein KVP17_001837 [Porospora cf. gigantea B]|uniref:uncharacterized protein n=1 Tax=Porospora cf. gigantea B TaxID=2853592 RepID=UPI003571E40F|nr:MAG: hypothetical protein KVP17_001837 [Porospora cf. gigantea B]